MTRIKADLESRAKALQHLTSLLTWQLPDTIVARRDHALSTLIEVPQGHPPHADLWGALPLRRANSLIQMDSGRRTAELALQLNDTMFVKKT